MSEAKNILGTKLVCCCTDPMTGFYRDGFCRIEGDHGVHAICAQVTEQFLAFTQKQGNDLSTPAPQFNFPGLKPGDRWCLCAQRWQEAWEAGVAPPVVLAATHARAVEYVDRQTLEKYATD